MGKHRVKLNHAHVKAALSMGFVDMEDIDRIEDNTQTIKQPNVRKRERDQESITDRDWQKYKSPISASASEFKKEPPAPQSSPIFDPKMFAKLSIAELAQMDPLDLSTHVLAKPAAIFSSSMHLQAAALGNAVIDMEPIVADQIDTDENRASNEGMPVHARGVLNAVRY